MSSHPDSGSLPEGLWCVSINLLSGQQRPGAQALTHTASSRRLSAPSTVKIETTFLWSGHSAPRWERQDHKDPDKRPKPRSKSPPPRGRH